MIQRLLVTYLDVLKKWLASLYDRGTGRLPANETLQHGRYIIIKTIGRGGMGAVYLAIDTKGPGGSSPVAIKELSQARLDDEQRREARELFRQEIDLLKSLSNPYIPPVYGSFEERGRSYMVMQYIQGETLQELLKRKHGYALPVKDVLLYGVQLCEALEYLHRQNIIFRDLKPSNIIVQNNGHIYLIDFGIARYFKPGQRADTHAFGTRGYMSPEQWGHEQTTPRSDLYSLGVTLHECLTREKSGMLSKPFQFTPAGRINWEVPPQLESLLEQLLQVDANLRPASAGHVRKDLKYIQTLAPVQYPVPPTVPVFPKGQQPVVLPGNATLPIAPAANPFAKTVPAPPTPLPVPPGPFTPPPRVPKPFTPRPLVPRTPVVNVLQARVSNIQKQLQTWTWSGNLWERAFLLPFLVATLVSAGAGYMLLRATHSYHLSALLLCASALLIALAASTDKRIRDPARGVLFFIDVGLALALLALQAFPDAQQALSVLSQRLTLNQVLFSALLVGAGVALFRPKERFAWVTHATIAGLAGLSALLYFSFGAQALQQVFLQLSLPLDSVPVITTGLALTLAGLALIALLRYAAPVERKDAFLLFAVSLALGLLQYIYGYGELQQQSVPFMTDSFRSLVTLNVVITALPLLLAFIALFTPPFRFPAVALLSLALLFALLQNYLGPYETFPLAIPGFTLQTTRVFAIDTLRQFIIDTLIAGGLLLLLRLRSEYVWIDHLALLAVATASGLLDYTLWDQQSRLMSPYLLHPDPSQVNQQFVIILGQGAAILLFALVAIALLLFALHAAIGLFQTLRPYTRIKLPTDSVQGLALRVERAVLFVAVMISALMPLAFESLVPTITAWVHQSWTGGQEDILAIVVLALFIPLLVCGIIMLARTFAPRVAQPGQAERFAVLLGALLGLLLLWRTPDAPFSTPVHLSGNVLHMSMALLQLLLTAGIILAAALAYYWVKRFSALHETLLLKANFVVVICCALLSVFAPFFLPLGLFLLLAGSMVVSQMERLR